jgi:NitT/TauT family transport system substrate-binding protein
MVRSHVLRGLAAAPTLALLPRRVVAQAALATIRAGVIGNTDATSLPIYGQGSGIFKKYGLTTEVSSFNGGGAIIAAIAGGSLDVGFSNLVSAASAVQRGIPVFIITPATIYEAKDRSDNLLVKAKGSKLRTGADLTGKTVAVTTLGGGLQLSAVTWIDKNGGDSKSVHFVELPNSEMAAALKQGRIEAAMLAEPVLSQVKDQVDVLGDAFGAVGGRYTQAVFVASKPWATANPDVAHRFVQAMVETARWANTHHADTAKIIAPMIGVDPASMASQPRSVYGDVLTAPLLQPVLDTAYHYGQLKTPMDAKQIVAEAQPYWNGVR